MTRSAICSGVQQSVGISLFHSLPTALSNEFGDGVGAVGFTDRRLHEFEDPVGLGLSSIGSTSTELR